MLDLLGLQAIRVEELGANRKPWESYYDMTDKVLRLAPAVYNGASASDIGMVAFECSHAIEHKEGINAAARQRVGILAFAGANLGLLLFVIGFASAASGLAWGVVLALLGFIIFGATAAIVLIRLPAERETARRAWALLENTDFAAAGRDAQNGAHAMIGALTWYYVGALSSIVGLWLG